MNSSSQQVIDFSLENKISWRKAALALVIKKISQCYKEAGITF